MVLSAPLPFEYEVDANTEEPLLGLSLRVTPGILGELVAEMDGGVSVGCDVPGGLSAIPLTDSLSDAVIRLLECLQSHTESRMLGYQNAREIIYRVLCGEQGGALRAMATRHSHFRLIAGALTRIHTDYANAIDVKALAGDAGMSVSAFYRAFRAVTSSSPLQYLKSIRLQKARTLMIQEGVGAGVAADQVGYESPSQFSREFKRFFGNDPAYEAAKMRAKVSPAPSSSSETYDPDNHRPR